LIGRGGICCRIFIVDGPKWRVTGQYLIPWAKPKQ
jgi:hypothetical protein